MEIFALQMDQESLHLNCRTEYIHLLIRSFCNQNKTITVSLGVRLSSIYVIDLQPFYANG
jgi:hypothetical protein